MVQRYDPSVLMDKADDGDYVEYADYKKLATFLEKLHDRAQFAQIPNYVLRREIEQALKESEKPK